MLNTTTTAGPIGRWHRAQVLLRLAGLAAVWYGLAVLPPGITSSGVGLAVAISGGLASIGWLVMINPPRRHPAVLTAMGALQLAGAVSAGMRPQDLGLLAVGLAAAAGLGAARGATVTVSVRDGGPWLRYRAATLALWAATVAVRVGLTVLAHAAGATVAGSGPALLLSAGVTLLAEGAVVAHRASTIGGQQWQAGVTGQHAALH